MNFFSLIFDLKLGNFLLIFFWIFFSFCCLFSQDFLLVFLMTLFSLLEFLINVSKLPPPYFFLILFHAQSINFVSLMEVTLEFKIWNFERIFFLNFFRKRFFGIFRIFFLHLHYDKGIIIAVFEDCLESW